VITSLCSGLIANALVSLDGHWHYSVDKAPSVLHTSRVAFNDLGHNLHTHRNIQRNPL